jgi:LysM repeat protein
VRRAALAAAVAVALATGLAAPAAADTQIYKVKAGDTLSLIAAEYYGDRNDYVFILTANKMDHPRKLKPGEKLKIPVGRDITTGPDDTFDKLAGAYLDDARRGRFLAQFNDKDPESTIPAGTALEIPFHVTHTAAGEESLAQISLSYFGTKSEAALLRDYNFLTKDALAKGESIVVPIHNVKVRAAKQPAADPQSDDRKRKLAATRAQAASALPRARKAALAGAFDDVKAELADLDLDYLDADVAAEVGLLLGEATVAFDDEPFTLATFRKVLKRKPGLVLDAYTYSPKMRDAWKKAGGAVEGE